MQKKEIRVLQTSSQKNKKYRKKKITIIEEIKNKIFITQIVINIFYLFFNLNTIIINGIQQGHQTSKYPYYH
jgi:hypothetical protein